ncbi:superoxide dismutase [Pedobacter glucosidilyticus]|uniref:superoxide dismutase n=1 Tax=Pedobacter glucosidilyticus TaxID=1122941 RepID=UPI00040F0AA3|nr:superoxide dismutase [Pedobacter glucosidilyticus]
MKNKLLLLAMLLATNSLFAQFTQKPLPYDYKALEPYIDAQTMEIHYSKHHAGYIKNLNDALKAKGVENQSIEAILANMSKYDTGIKNNAGGHYNHELFWSILSPKKSNPSAELSAAINASFKSLDGLKNKLNDAAVKRFGSGWAWLIVDESGNLVVSSTANQDNPLMEGAAKKGIPILGIDVWEHAYYLKYQNKRADYLSAIWNVINWDEVSKRYNEAKKAK